MAKILVIEDGETVRLWVSQTLLRKGHEVSSAEDGRHALGKLGSFSPDIILLDINMPVMDGPEFIVASREIVGAHVPIVVITANQYPLNALPSDLRIAAVLTKPFTAEELESTVTRFTPLVPR